MNIELVEPKPEDYLKADKLFLQLHNIHAKSYPDYYNELSQFIDEDEFDEFIMNKSRIITLAKYSDEILGLIWAEIKEKPENKYMKARKELWLEGIVVDEKHRNLGIGKLLIENLIEKGREQGFDSIELMVWSKNDEALKLYKRYFEERATIMSHPL